MSDCTCIQEEQFNVSVIEEQFNVSIVEEHFNVSVECLTVVDSIDAVRLDFSFTGQDVGVNSIYIGTPPPNQKAVLTYVSVDELGFDSSTQITIGTMISQALLATIDDISLEYLGKYECKKDVEIPNRDALYIFFVNPVQTLDGKVSGSIYFQ